MKKTSKEDFHDALDDVKYHVQSRPSVDSWATLKEWDPKLAQLCHEWMLARIKVKRYIEEPK